VTRGELVTVALPGDYGKLRPAVVVQADLFNETHASVTIAPVTSTLVNAPLFRLAVEPSPRNGLRALSQVMAVVPAMGCGGAWRGKANRGSSLRRTEAEEQFEPLVDAGELARRYLSEDAADAALVDRSEMIDESVGRLREAARPR
jgi:hypothetical protein